MPNTDLQAQFEQAAQAAMSLPKRPDDKTLLRLYGLYKQAAAGDVQGRRPGFADFRGRAKYDAWARYRGKSSEWAMREYIKLVESLGGKP